MYRSNHISPFCAIYIVLNMHCFIIQKKKKKKKKKTNQHFSPKMDIFSRSNYEVAELTWENGQLSMHGLGVLQPTTSTRAGDTLESIVHQATCHNPIMNSHQHDQNIVNISSTVASSGGGNSSRTFTAPGPVRKRTWTESDLCGINFSNSVQDERMNQSACASASATFCRENDRTMMTWASSFESPSSVKTKVADEDSACQDGSENRDEEQETKEETGRSRSTRRSRAAAIHNQSERRRRDRINQKMKALQKLVPNSNKTDKASMLDEVIEYLKQLQAQIQMMNTVRNVPQMMVPMGMQNHHHLQMSLLARMARMGGLGMGMGMLDMSTMARTPTQSLSPLMHPFSVAAPAAPTFCQAPFVMPTTIPTSVPSQLSHDPSSNASVSIHDPYSTLLAQQSMNMDMYNKMAALYRQQYNQTTQGTLNQSQSNHDQRI